MVPPAARGRSATNFHVQQYEGKPVLTWWQGRILEVGFGQGEDGSLQHLLPARGHGARRQRLPRRPARNQADARRDGLDRRLRPDQDEPLELHGVADGVLLDSVIEEVDVKTGLVMWEWHALGHVPLSESLNPVPGSPTRGTTSTSTPSIPGRSGDVLLSARNMWTLYDVDLHSGHPLAPRRPAQQLQARAGRALLLAARRRIPARTA